MTGAIMAMSGAERQARYHAKIKLDAKPVVTRYRRPKDRRSRPKRWADATDELMALLDGYEEWHQNLPSPLVGSDLEQRLIALLEMRELVEQLQTADLPLGYGRD